MGLFHLIPVKLQVSFEVDDEFISSIQLTVCFENKLPEIKIVITTFLSSLFIEITVCIYTQCKTGSELLKNLHDLKRYKHH